MIIYFANLSIAALIFALLLNSTDDQIRVFVFYLEILRALNAPHVSAASMTYRNDSFVRTCSA